MTYLKNIIAGIVIGVANIIPGVSGGTMAVVLGIYDRLIDAISLNLGKLKKNWKFILTLGIGMVFGISVVAKLLTWLFKNYNVPTQFFFIGLILGSIPLVWRKTTETKNFKKINIIPFLITLGVMVLMAVMKQGENTVDTKLTVTLFIILVLSGAIASFAMIIPGISGAFLLKVLGQYETISAAASIGDFNFAILIPVAIGIVLGLLVGAKLISTLLKKYHQGIYAAILGLIVGSVIEIYPTDFEINLEGVIAVIVAVIGFAIPIFMQKIGGEK